MKALKSLTPYVMAFGLLTGIASARPIDQELEQVKAKVKAQATEIYISDNSPSDSVYIFEGRRIKIESCIRYTIFKTDDGLFVYDFSNDRSIDSLIKVNGQVNEHEENFIDLEGLSQSHREAEKLSIDLNDFKQRAFGKTPYNTRECYFVGSDNSIAVADFNKNQYAEINDKELTKQFLTKLQQVYTELIEKAKTELK